MQVVQGPYIGVAESKSRGNNVSNEDIVGFCAGKKLGGDSNADGC